MNQFFGKKTKHTKKKNLFICSLFKPGADTQVRVNTKNKFRPFPIFDIWWVDRGNNTLWLGSLFLSSAPASLHQSAVSFRLVWRDGFVLWRWLVNKCEAWMLAATCLPPLKSQWLVLFSGLPLDGTVSSHYAAEAEGGGCSRIQWREPISTWDTAIQF